MNRLWVEFDCVIPVNVTYSTARYEVTFLFDGRPSNDVPVSTVDGGTSSSDIRATLHERYLSGKMGKWVSMLYRRRDM